MTIARYLFENHTLDLAKRELQQGSQVVALPARAFECLCYLIEHRDRAVGRDELVQAVFARADVSDAQLAQVVLRSRRAIGDDGQEQRSIRTVPRFGFRWVAPVSAELVGEDEREPPLGMVHSPNSNSNAQRSPAPNSISIAPRVPDATATPIPRAPSRIVRFVEAPTLKTRGRLLAVGVMATMLAMTLLVVSAIPRFAHGPTPATAALPGGGIMVLPTQVDGPSDVAWARLGLMDFVADRMRRAGLPALSSDATLGVLRENAALANDPQRLRHAARTTWVVTSRARRVQDQWSVDLAAAGDSDLVEHGQARNRELLEATRIASDHLMAALGGRLPRREDSDPNLAERLQRAQAAMLANELETARQILLGAPELQRAQPQLRYRLAQVDLRAGEFTRGLATLDELLDSGAARDDRLFNARLLIARGAMLVRLNRYVEAERSYDRAAGLLRGTPFAADLGQALTGRAITHSSQGDFDDALADLGLARVELARAGDNLAMARVDANLGNVEMDRGRPAQAIGYYRKAAGDFESMGAVNELAGLRGMLMSANLALLQTDEALAESRRAWTLRKHIRDPGQRANLLLGRAEVLIADGQLSEARRLLQMPDAAQTAPSDFGRREFLQMELAWRGGDARSTVLLADAALKEWPPQSNPRLRAWTLLRRQQAAQAADMTPLSVSSVGDSLPERLMKSLELRRQGNEPAADASYRAALALAEQHGIPDEIAEVVEAYASWLLDRNRMDAAAALIGRVAPWAEQDFDLALLQAQLFRKLGQQSQWRAALGDAQRLAGERRISAELTLDMPARR